MTTVMETASQWGPLWGARPYDWASVEEQQRPCYDKAIETLGIGPGQRVLDVGCGSGVFLEAAAACGAHVAGIDAAETLLAIARSRVPEADLRRGDLQSLPFEDDRFDVVTGFCSFFFAADMTGALREAARVAKPGGRVLALVWGRPERCEIDPMKRAVMKLVPGAQEPPPLWKPGVLESMARQAGLTPDECFDVRSPYEFADERSMLAGVMGAGGPVAAVRAAGYDAVAEAVLRALASCRGADGSYRIENEWHALVARA